METYASWFEATRSAERQETTEGAVAWRLRVITVGDRDITPRSRAGLVACRGADSERRCPGSYEYVFLGEGEQAHLQFTPILALGY